MHFRINQALFTPLNDIWVKLAMDDIKLSKSHKPCHTPHEPIATIKTVVANLQDMLNDCVVAFTILIMYYARTRQSDVDPPGQQMPSTTPNTLQEQMSPSPGAP